MNFSKHPIDDLVRSTEATIQELYSTILDDISVLEINDGSIPVLLQDVAELRMDIKFILVDLQTIFLACFRTDKAYEKRYHLKNLYAGMLESYKLLYGFKKMRKKTIWARIGRDLQTVGREELTLFDRFRLKERYEEITQKLLTIEANETERDNRNLTYHYDDDLLLVYRITLKTDSEEDAAKKYFSFIEILGSILEFVNQVELVEAIEGKIIPNSSGRHDELALMIVQRVAKILGNNSNLNRALLTAVDIGGQELDRYANYKRGIIKACDYLSNTLLSKIDIPEFGIINQLLDLQMLISFVKADIATILKSFVGAKNKVEYPLILRRLTISRVSMLSHLISYKENISKSMWYRIISVIPTDRQELFEDAEKILKEMKCLRKSGDCNKRKLYIHLIDNKTYHSNIPEIVKSLENVAILAELPASQEMISFCGRLSLFLAHLMEALSIQARNSRIESSSKLKSRIREIREITNHPKFPEIFRKSMRKQMEDLEKQLEFDSVGN